MTTKERKLYGGLTSQELSERCYATAQVMVKPLNASVMRALGDGMPDDMPTNVKLHIAILGLCLAAVDMRDALAVASERSGASAEAVDTMRQQTNDMARGVFAQDVRERIRGEMTELAHSKEGKAMLAKELDIGAGDVQAFVDRVFGPEGDAGDAPAKGGI